MQDEELIFEMYDKERRVKHEIIHKRKESIFNKLFSYHSRHDNSEFKYLKKKFRVTHPLTGTDHERLLYSHTAVWLF